MVEQHRGHDIESGNHISLREVASVDVRVAHLSVSIDVSPSAAAAAMGKLLGKSNNDSHVHVKSVLNDISADMPAGSLTAIIGGSGSGKTTMLNSISRRLHG